MQKLEPAAIALAAHPIPSCADPASLYAQFVNGIYAIGSGAYSAKGLSGLLRAAARLEALKKVERKLKVELNRTA